METGLVLYTSNPGIKSAHSGNQDQNKSSQLRGLNFYVVNTWIECASLYELK